MGELGGNEGSFKCTSSQGGKVSNRVNEQIFTPSLIKKYSTAQDVGL